MIEKYENFYIPLSHYDREEFFEKYVLKEKVRSFLKWSHPDFTFIRQYKRGKLFLYLDRPEPFSESIYLETFSNLGIFFQKVPLENDPSKKALITAFL